MTLPETFTLIRHGHSEANYVQELVKNGEKDVTLPKGLFERHDANMRLTARGVDQAIATGEWLKTQGLLFDRYYVSPHTRTRETAVNLSIADAQWRVDDRFRERDWGEIHYVNPDNMQDPLSDASRHNRSLSQWYWKPMAGESLATGVRLRADAVMNSLYRREGIKHTLGVTHGEFIRTCQFVIERMTPDQWEQMDADRAYKMQNCMVLQYSRHEGGDPTAPLSQHFTWRRATCPWDESLSWDGGQWVPVKFRKYTNDDLRASIAGYEPLFRTDGS